MRERKVESEKSYETVMLNDTPKYRSRLSKTNRNGFLCASVVGYCPECPKWGSPRMRGLECPRWVSKAGARPMAGTDYENALCSTGVQDVQNNIG